LLVCSWVACNLRLNSSARNAFVLDAARRRIDATSWEIRNDYGFLAAAVAEGDSHEDLADVLQDWMGTEVAVGVCPNFWVSDYEGLISRAKSVLEGPR